MNNFLGLSCFGPNPIFIIDSLFILYDQGENKCFQVFQVVFSGIFFSVKLFIVYILYTCTGH